MFRGEVKIVASPYIPVNRSPPSPSVGRPSVLTGAVTKGPDLHGRGANAVPSQTGVVPSTVLLGTPEAPRPPTAVAAVDRPAGATLAPAVPGHGVARPPTRVLDEDAVVVVGVDRLTIVTRHVPVLQEVVTVEVQAMVVALVGPQGARRVRRPPTLPTTPSVVRVDTVMPGTVSVGLRRPTARPDRVEAPRTATPAGDEAREATPGRRVATAALVVAARLLPASATVPREEARLGPVAANVHTAVGVVGHGVPVTTTLGPHDARVEVGLLAHHIRRQAALAPVPVVPGQGAFDVEEVTGREVPGQVGPSEGVVQALVAPTVFRTRPRQVASRLPVEAAGLEGPPGLILAPVGVPVPPMVGTGVAAAARTPRLAPPAGLTNITSDGVDEEDRTDTYVADGRLALGEVGRPTALDVLLVQARRPVRPNALGLAARPSFQLHSSFVFTRGRRSAPFMSSCLDTNLTNNHGSRGRSGSVTSWSSYCASSGGSRCSSSTFFRTSTECCSGGDVQTS